MDLFTSFQDYLLKQKNPPSENTLRNYLADVRHFVKWFEQIYQKSFAPAQITSSDVLQFKQFLEDSKYHPNTIERHVSTLRKFFQFLTSYALMGKNPFEDEAFDKLQTTDIYRLDEFKRFLYGLGREKNTIKNYLSDLENFFAWLDKIDTDYRVGQDVKMEKVNAETISKYKERLLSIAGLSPISVNRKLSSLRLYCQWAKEKGHLSKNPFDPPDGGVILTNEGNHVFEQPSVALEEFFAQEKGYSGFAPIRLLQKVSRLADRILVTYLVAPIANLFIKNEKPSLGNIGRYVRKDFYAPLKQDTKLDLRSFIFLLCFGFIGVGGFFAYEHFFTTPKPQTEKVQQQPLEVKKDTYSFAGRLADRNGKPVSEKSSVVFSFYSDPASFDKVLYQTVTDITPDENGFFTVNLDDVPQAVISSTNPVYIGTAIRGDAEMAPRQLINLEKASAASLLDSQGNVTLPAQSPTIEAQTGTLNLSAEELSFRTKEGSNGSLVLWPDGVGKIDTLAPLTNSITGIVQTNDALFVNAGSTQDPFSVQVGENPVFWVDNVGNTTIRGNLALSGMATLLQNLIVLGNTSISGSLSNLSTGGLYSIWYDDTNTAGQFQGRVLKQSVVQNIDFANYNPASKTKEYSGRIVGYISSEFSETYTFYLTTDDGGRLWIAHTKVIDSWQDQSEKTVTGTINLTKNQWYPIILEHYVGTTASERLKLEWSSPSLSRQTIPDNHLAYSLSEVPQTIFSNIRTDYDVRIGGSTTISGDLTVNGNSLITNTATFNLVNANATTINFGGGATAIAIGAASGTTTINNNLAVTNNATITGTVTVGSCTGCGGMSGGIANFIPLWTGASSIGLSDIYQTGGNIGIGTSTPGTAKLAVLGGNVGIGTTSPNFGLEVLGTAHITGNSTFDGTINGQTISAASSFTGTLNVTTGFQIAGSAASGQYLRGNGTNFVSSAIQYGDLPSTAQAWSTSSGNVYLTADSNNVGIGTSSPAVKLHLVGTEYLSGNLGIGTSSPGTRLAVAGGGLIGYIGTETAPTNGLAVFGNVGIGTSSPGFKLDVAGGGRFNCTANFANGGNQTTSCSDVAEVYSSDENLEKGDLVRITGDQNVGKTTKMYDDIIGVYSTSPGILVGGNAQIGGDEELNLPQGKVPVALTGRAPTKVSTENGVIAVGDSLTSSSIPGVAMKATKAGPTIGKALEAFSCSSLVVSNSSNDQRPTTNSCQGKILVFVNVSWYDPDFKLTTISDFSLTPINISEQIPRYTVYDAVGELTTKVAGFSDAIIGNLTAGTISAQFAKIGQLIVQQLTVDSVTVNNEIISPLAEIDRVRTNVISPLASDTVVVDGRLTVKVASDSASPIALDVQGDASVSGELTVNKVSSQELEVSGDATVSGTLRVSQLIADQIVGLQAQIATIAAETLSGLQKDTKILGYYDTTGNQDATASAHNILISQSPNIALDASPSAALRIDTFYANQGSFLEGLLAIGPSGFSDVSISGILSLGSQFILTNNSINVLGADLALQPLGQGGVSIAQGKVYIDSTGNLTTEGNVTVKGTLSTNIISPIPDEDLVIKLANHESITPNSKFIIQDASGSAVLTINQQGDLFASGSAQFNKLKLPEIIEKVAADGQSIPNNGSVGKATINAGTYEVTIETPFVTEDSLIYITPTSDTSGMVPYIARQIPGESFTVAIPDYSDQDTTFNWWIIN